MNSYSVYNGNKLGFLGKIRGNQASHGLIVSPQLTPCRRTSRLTVKSSNESKHPDEPNPPVEDSQSTSYKPSIVDPVQTIQWGGTLPSPRRLVLGGLAGLSIVLFGNFLGATSFLLGQGGGGLARSLRLDVLFPVKGYKRCVDYQNGYEFIYPASWLADQQLYRRYAERVERERSLDPPSPRQLRAKLKYNGVPEPSAGFGPPGGTGEDNISVIVAPIRPGFTLAGMGTAKEAAERFLSSTVAPPGSDRIATLVNAYERRDGSGELYYTMEFIVELPGKFKRHNVATYASRNGLLFTFNAQCAERNWAKYQQQLTTASQSFTIISSGAATEGYPDQI